MYRKNRNNTILPAILYGDIFDYPLTKEEIKKYQISQSKGKGERGKGFTLREGFYCLKGREDIITKRIQRKKISDKKIIFAKKITNSLKYIATIKLIGLSGSVAIENADENDDIDFFIISKKGMVWFTRLCILLLLQIFGVRRKKNDTDTKNKICVNMLIDEINLCLPRKKQNLYTAHEIIQMKPLFIRDNMYNKFLYANKWIKDYLPNAVNPKDTKILRYKDIKKNKIKSLNILVSQSLNILEFFSKKMQLWYMQKYKTTEITTDTMLAFHPIDHGQRILEEYGKRLKKI